MAKTTDIAKAGKNKAAKHDRRGAQKSKAARRRNWTFRIIMAVLLLILISGAVLWANRYAVIKNLAVENLKKHGIDAELDIQSLSKTHAIVKNIKLSHRSKDIFEAKRVEARYDWREALEGRIKSAILTQPRAYVTLDKSGKIIDDWLPARDRASSDMPINLPENGLTIQNGTIFAQSPYGMAEISGDANLKTLEDFMAKLTIAPTELRHNGLRASGGAQLDIDMGGGQAKVKTQIILKELSHPAIEAKAIRISLDGLVDIGAKSFNGQTDMDFQTLETDQVILGASQIQWDGHFNKTAKLFDLDGHWTANLDKARIPNSSRNQNPARNQNPSRNQDPSSNQDPTRSEALAATLSFHKPLSKSPIAQHFIPELKDILHSLMTGSHIRGRGHILRNDDGFALTLTAPALLTSQATRLTLTPHKTAPAYYFETGANRITAAMDASFTAPARLSLMDINFKAKSSNGLSLDKVEDFSAQIITSDPWINNGIDGRAARLSPLSLYMIYDGKSPRKRIVNISGAVNYDGALPGAYVQGLKTAGDMVITLIDKQLTIGYAPKTGSRLRIDKLETTTDWTAYNIDTDISPNKNIFERASAKGDSRINLILSDTRLNLGRAEPPAQLKVNADRLRASGILSKSNQGADGLTQNWQTDFMQAIITSDDLPGPETKITLPSGHLDAALVTDRPPYFDLTTPAANIQTQLIKAEDMRLRVYGISDNYDIEHSGGRVKLEGNTLPPIPIEGQLNVAGGTFIGTANARLPQADNTPIAMTYNIKDGAGFADVDIDMLEFSPNGLQPQSLISALRGKIAQVEGIASAKIHLDFARGQALKSSGTAKIINMNLGTAPGPIKGMNMELTMDSVLPLISRGKQRITVAEFDPGIPLFDGVIDFELVDEGVKIYSAKWPIEHGFFSLDPFTWKYGAEENRLTLRLSDVELGEFMQSMGNDNIEATGQVQGEFPIVISGVKLHVDNGRLTIKDGGTIRYNPPSEGEAPPISYTQEEALKILRTKDQARYSSLARDALREFKYKELSVKIDGPLDGEVELATVFNGSNAKVLNGQPFEFDIHVIGELFNIIRSFDSNAQIKSELAKQGISTDGLSIEPN